MHHHIHNKTLRTRHQTPLTPCVHHGHAFHAIARRSSTRVHALGDWVKKFFDVSDGNWGPKSTRIWRTQNYEYTSGNDEAEDENTPAGEPSTAASAERAIEDLQARLNSLPTSSRPSLDEDDMPLATTSSSSTATRGPGGPLGSDDDVGSGFDMRPLTGGSFSDADDGDLAVALNRRIGQIAASTASFDSEVTEEEMRQPLTAAELRQLIYSKYGKTYDVSFVRRDIPGKTFVCLNIMWTHLEQRSFKLTEEQYMDKLDGVAYLIGALGQTDRVRAFLKERARSQKGLPPRPVVGTAISIRFDLEQSVIEEWFGKGYQ